MEIALTVLIYGLIKSVTLALIAIGFSLTFGISGVANLAHGGLYILAGYITWQLLISFGLPYALAVVLSVIACGLIGALIYRLVLLRVRGLMLSEVIATFGLGIAILESLRWAGLITYKYKLPTFIKGSFEIGGVVVDYQRLLVVIIGLLLVAALWFFIHRTKIGLAFRGIAQNERTALAYGIESDRAAMLSVAFGSALAAVAAITILPLGPITVDTGLSILITAFAVGIVGGLESTLGIIVAAFLLGYSQTTVAYLFATKWIMIVNLVAIVLVLVIKPSGLFGKFKELEERV